MKKPDIKYLDSLTDKQKEAIFDVEIENLTSKDVLEKYGDILTEEQKIKLGKPMKKPIIKILQQAGMEVEKIFYPNSDNADGFEIRKGNELSFLFQYPNGMISNRNLIGLIDIDFTPPSPADQSPDSDLPQDQ